MKATNNFSIFDRMKSIRFALEGIIIFFRSQHNAIIHLLFTILVIQLAYWTNTSALEVIALVIVMGLVWCAELFNTAIELMMDHLSPEKHLRVKAIKDLSAAAVLVCAITAAITGLIIFIPKLF